MIAETGATRFYGLALGIVTLSLTARLLGPDGRGIVATVTSWSMFLALFAGFSLGEVSQHRIQLRKTEDWLPALLGAQLFFTVTLGLASIGGALLVYWMTDGELIKNVPYLFVMIGLAFIPFLIWDNLARFLLIGADRLRDYNKIQFAAGNAGFVLTILFLVYLGMGVLGVLIAGLVAGVLFSVVKFYVLWKAAGRRMRLAVGDVVGMLGSALKVHLNAIGGILLIEANVLMLNHLGSAREVGWFQLAFQLMMMLLIIPQSASMALFSRVAEVGPDTAWPEQRRLMIQLLALMAGLSLVAYILAPYAVMLLAGPEFGPAVPVFRYLLVLLLALTLTLVLAPQWFARGIFLPKSIVALLAGIVNVGLNLVLIPAYGMMGVVASVLISYVAIVTVSQLVFVVWLEMKAGIFSDAARVAPSADQAD